MTCTDYEVQIGDYVDGELDARVQAALETHLAVCEPCRSVMEDLRVIRAASLTLESHTPSPHLWTRIAAAVEAERQGPKWTLAPPQWLRQPLAAGVIVLVLAAGISWMAWRDLSRTAEAPDRDPVQPIEADLKLAEDHYAQAIAGLEAITKPGGTELDEQTADVLQANLTVIDQAIGESRAALQTEPSDLAQESLFEALRSKVALLQETVALINEMRRGNEEGAARIVSDIRQ